MTAGKIPDFYSGEGADHLGRSLADIVVWSDERLEYTHDYIQWMFPLTEGSAVNPYAPVLDSAVIAEFRGRPELRSKLLQSFDRMLQFYGFQREQTPVLAVVRAANFPDRSRNWLSANNHNHLRITRMLRSLRLLGLEAESKAFFDCLREIYEVEKASARPRISADSFRFWKAAAAA